MSSTLYQCGGLKYLRVKTVSPWSPRHGYVSLGDRPFDLQTEHSRFVSRFQGQMLTFDSGGAGVVEDVAVNQFESDVLGGLSGLRLCYT